MLTVKYENLTKLNHRFLEKEHFKNALNSGWYIRGSYLEQFQEQFAEYLGAKFCVGVGNGFDSLFISLSALKQNAQNRTEILMPANSYIATVFAVYHAGFQPTFIDVSFGNIFPDQEAIMAHINDSTAGIILTHFYGFLCPAIIDLREMIAPEVFILEDCAQSTGTVFDGKHAGTYGDVACHSFYPTKNLGGIGDGGAITTNSSRVFDVIKNFGNYGSHVKYKNSQFGVNSRLDEIQAAFLIGKLSEIDTILERKREYACYYKNEFSDVENISLIEQKSVASYHIFPVFVDNRDELKRKLSQSGISTELHYPILPLDQTSIMGNSKIFINSKQAAERELSIPISAALEWNEVEYVAKVIKQLI